MAENQKDPKKAGSQQGQSEKNAGTRNQSGNASSNKISKSTENEEGDAEGTKLPGRKTNTPTAEQKSGQGKTQDQNNRSITGATSNTNKNK